ncbi:MAG: gliding motility-associated C-terminal domain-containing protein [Fluviicola sp.]|nr:gliding motility-associated C-terminal domain-containing protein [Fluviicola sp.]
MKNYFNLFLFALTTCMFSLSAKATHIVGGEIYYDSLGNNQYKITFEIYRDCGPGNSDFDNPLQYRIFYGNGALWSDFSVDISSRNILPVVYDDPCVTPPNDICIERAIYIDTVTLPFDVGGYFITYQRCCWANNIDNITNPGDNGITLTTFVPGSALTNVHNQGARFVNYPPLVLCNNNTLTFDHSAFDPDGDSLAYEVIAPFSGGSSLDANPLETAPPYSDVIWEPTYSALVPFGAGSSVTIDPVTGMMDFSPNLIGTYVAGVAVKEYRNGVLINTKTRTFGYRVVACEVEIPVEVDVTGTANLIEDCGFSGFIVSRTDTTTTLVVQVLLSGTAINGTDYSYIPDTLTIPTGVFSDTIGITAFLDGLVEGVETVEFNIIIEHPCDGTFDTTSISIEITDYIDMVVTYLDSTNFCADQGETTQLWCYVENGRPPFNYNWGPGFFPNNDTVTVLPNMVGPNLNQFNIIISDACGKTVDISPINVYNQCPLIVPNVMTANGDGTNDALIITNWEDYDKVSLTIFNRWGNIVYENGDYQNDWMGIDKGGKQLTEGVYFYLVTPTSEKYEYDDVKDNLYTAHGFFQLYTK